MLRCFFELCAFLNQSYVCAPAAADLIFMVQILHPTLSAPKRTHMIKVASKLLALKTNGLGECFKYKDVSAPVGIRYRCKPVPYQSHLPNMTFATDP